MHKRWGCIALSMAVTGCYHWVPTTLEEVRAHPYGQLRANRGADVRSGRVSAEGDTLFVSDRCASGLPTQTVLDASSFASTASRYVIEATVCSLATVSASDDTTPLAYHMGDERCPNMLHAAVDINVHIEPRGDDVVEVALTSADKARSAFVTEARDELMSRLARTEGGTSTPASCATRVDLLALPHPTLERRALNVEATIGLVMTTTVLVIGTIVAVAVFFRSISGGSSFSFGGLGSGNGI